MIQVSFIRIYGASEKIGIINNYAYYNYNFNICSLSHEFSLTRVSRYTYKIILLFVHFIRVIVLCCIQAMVMNTNEFTLMTERQ